MEKVLKDFLSEDECKIWFTEKDDHLEPSPEAFMRLVSEMHIVAAVAMWNNDWSDHEFPEKYFWKWMDYVGGNGEMQ